MARKSFPWSLDQSYPWSLVQSWPIHEDSDDLSLIVIRQTSTQENSIPPLTLHVPIIESCTPPSTEQLQEDGSTTVVTLPTTSTSSTTSTQSLSDTAKPTEIQVVLPQQSTLPQSDSLVLPPQASCQVICSILLLTVQKISLIPEHVLIIQLVVPRFFLTLNGDKLESMFDANALVDSKPHQAMIS